MGDFNGRIGDKIYGGYPGPVRNTNGERLLDFADDSHLNIVNCTRKCYGKITWFMNSQSSCIDYFLSSDITYNCIHEMIVNEER